MMNHLPAERIFALYRVWTLLCHDLKRHFLTRFYPPSGKLHPKGSIVRFL